MSNPWVVLAVTVGLIAVSALFVAIEFALLTARRHRLEDAAARSRSARAALRSATWNSHCCLPARNWASPHARWLLARRRNRPCTIG